MGEFMQLAPPARGQDHGLDIGFLPQIAALGAAQFIRALQIKDMPDRSDPVFNIGQGFRAEDGPGGLLHGPHRGAEQVIGPDHQADPGLAEGLGRGAVIHGRHDHQRQTAGPFPGEGQHLIRPC